MTDNWTPLQDLDDEDDYYDGENNIQLKPKTTNNIETTLKNNKNAMYIFSLSLPRDVHLQCQMKTSQNCQAQESILKAANCWLVPGFNSLQNFKIRLNKNNIDTKTTNKSNGYSFVDKKNHDPDYEIYKTSSKPPPIYSNENWLLHESKTNPTSLCAKSKTTGDPYLKSSNTHLFADLQLKSTKFCGCKHIVYLPSQDEFNILNKNEQKYSKQPKSMKSYKKQHQKLVRESLQDLNSVQNIHKLS